MDDLFSGMAIDEGYPAAIEVASVLKRVGLISVGSIGGAVLADKVLAGITKNPMLTSGVEAAIGVLGAGMALNARSDAIFWLLVGVGVHGVTDLLRQALGTAGILPA